MTTPHFATSLLVEDTCVISDSDKFIAYCPFTKKIAQFSDPVWEKAENLKFLRKQGLFNPPPREKPSGHFTSLTLFLTQDCNLACTYCYAQSQRSHTSMNWLLAKKAIDAFAKQYRGEVLKVNFHGGGEPTLEFNLLKQVVSYCHTLPYSSQAFSLITNGVTNRAMLEFLVKHQFTLTISVDGPPQIQNFQRPLKAGKPSSTYVENTIQWLVERDYPFTVRPTLTLWSTSAILKVLEYFQTKGVKKILLQPLSSGPGCPFEEASPSLEGWIKALLAALDFAEQYDLQIINSSVESITTGKIGSYCGAMAGETLVVTTKGLLTGCYEVVGEESQGAEHFLYGKIGNRLQIDQEKQSKLSSRMVGNIQECQTCFAKFICAGTCPMKAWRKTGNMFEKDPYTCQFSKTVIPKLIKRIAQRSWPTTSI